MPVYCKHWHVLFLISQRATHTHFKCIWMTQSTFANWSLSLFIDAQLSQGHLGTRDDLSDGPQIPRGIKERDSGAEWQLYALNAPQMFFSLGLSCSASKYFNLFLPILACGVYRTKLWLCTVLSIHDNLIKSEAVKYRSRWKCLKTFSSVQILKCLPFVNNVHNLFF